MLDPTRYDKPPPATRNDCLLINSVLDSALNAALDSVLYVSHLFHGAFAISNPMPHQSVTPAKIRPAPMKALRP